MDFRVLSTLTVIAILAYFWQNVPVTSHGWLLFVALHIFYAVLLYLIWKFHSYYFK